MPAASTGPSSQSPGQPALDSLPAVITRLRFAGCVFAEDEAELLVSAARTPAELVAMVDRRVAGFPLEHILGWAQFFSGRQIAVGPGVFAHRRRTELLVQEAVALVRQAGAAPPVRTCADPAGPGMSYSTCAAAQALRTRLWPRALNWSSYTQPTSTRPRCAVPAATSRPPAVRPTSVTCYEPLPTTLRGRVDILIANAPYVPTGSIGLTPPEARLHEARVAVDAGPDGLDVLRRVAAGAPQWLAPGGHLLIETSQSQSAQAVEFMEQARLSASVVSSDELDATAVIGTATSVG